MLCFFLLRCYYPQVYLGLWILFFLPARSKPDKVLRSLRSGFRASSRSGLPCFLRCRCLPISHPCAYSSPLGGRTICSFHISAEA
ncbi:hypothetical protein ZOSMA_9G01080 [Zostera marina]|uniref:Uncharacterized protein n=1 Tax=Zostera marina TaxID=29655 RepID=A0A0K9NH87_ZOSMR|nr:hypothetical protein ZOSMA_9G01080 [Zostera marina]